jgi:hypothetical protein
LNKQPVIGIFTQTIKNADGTLAEEFKDPKYENKTSYIMSAYTKYIEA